MVTPKNKPPFWWIYFCTEEYFYTDKCFRTLIIVLIIFDIFENDITCHETQRKLLRGGIHPLRSWMKTQRRESRVFRRCRGNRGKFRASRPRCRKNLWCDRALRSGIRKILMIKSRGIRTAPRITIHRNVTGRTPNARPDNWSNAKCSKPGFLNAYCSSRQQLECLLIDTNFHNCSKLNNHQVLKYSQ